jgi:hypothetical protein
MAARVATITFVASLAFVSPAAAYDRLPVPGGTSALRTVTELPASVPDDMLLVEVVRSWYGTRDPLTNPDPGLRRMLEYFRTAKAPLADGPPLPLNAAVWAKLLNCERPCNLAATLVTSRSAMLLYHGLMAVDDETQRWLAQHPDLLTSLLEEGAPAFAFAGPFVHVRGGTVDLPGGAAVREAWSSLIGGQLTRPENVIRMLMRRDAGRLAWLFSVLAQFDEAHVRFAVAGGEEALSALARHARTASPEWIIAERPFWRVAFDFSLALAFVDLDAGGAPRGSRAFWREVFRTDDLRIWRPGRPEPLTATALVEVLFADPNQARQRWEVFCLGQRLPGVDSDAREAGLALRAARQHPALAQMLDRIGVSKATLLLSVHRASARVFDKDSYGGSGELAAWQGTLAIIERAALSGGLDAAGIEATLTRLSSLRLEDPKRDLTSWFLETFIPELAGRPGAPQDAERLVLQVISGGLTVSGPRREPAFSWEDMAYSFGAPASLVDRMEEARAAQRSASVEDARVAWRIASGAAPNQVEALAARLRDVEIPADAREIAGDLERAWSDRNSQLLRREARRAAEAIVPAVLPGLAYAPHLAVTETPALGADIAFRHEFVSNEDGPAARRLRPWQVARGQATPEKGWRMQGSLLLLDVALADWYLRRNSQPAGAAPMFDEGDRTALAGVAAFTRSAGASSLGLREAAVAVETGRRAAASAPSMAALDQMLDTAGISPWRRKALSMLATDPARVAELLSYGEAWRVGGAPGRLSPHPAMDGGAHLGVTPRSTLLMEGRRNAGLVGAATVDAQLRVAVFLSSRQLPDRLFGDVAAGVIDELVQGTHASRPDDFSSFAASAARVDDSRMEEHLLALVADGTLARPAAGH